MIGAHLLEGLGDYRFEVTTTHPQVQRWFDQGMMLAYGFNHDAAERSFLKATELDPACAMCWWGASLVLGPHVNAAMDPADNPDALRLRSCLCNEAVKSHFEEVLRGVYPDPEKGN